MSVIENMDRKKKNLAYHPISAFQSKSWTRWRRHRPSSWWTPARRCRARWRAGRRICSDTHRMRHWKISGTDRRRTGSTCRWSAPSHWGSSRRVGLVRRADPLKIDNQRWIWLNENNVEKEYGEKTQIGVEQVARVVEAIPPIGGSIAGGWGWVGSRIHWNWQSGGMNIV